MLNSKLNNITAAKKLKEKLPITDKYKLYKILCGITKEGHIKNSLSCIRNTNNPITLCVGPFSCIGYDGFSIVYNKKIPYKLPHIGKVYIGDNVEIGSFVTIARGTIEDTIIGDNAQIDDRVHIAHNCKIGKNVVIGAGAIIGGSTIVDDNAVVYLGQIIPAHSHIKSTQNKNVCDTIDGVTTKLIITDLDNTLWDGIIGDDGIDNIIINGKYLELQKKLKELSQKGVLLAIISKNNEQTALHAIDHHKDMILRSSDFITHRINWTDKATNLTGILTELNLTDQGVIFIDDSPYERDYMQGILPGINTITNEDLDKLNMYKVEKTRQTKKKTFSSLDAWIKSLNIELNIRLMQDSDYGRVLQLFNKTNQMNLNGKRFSTLDNFKTSDIWVCSAKDKLGPYGIIAAVIIRDHIVTHFAMSCRAMGRKIEYNIFNTLISKFQYDLIITPIITMHNVPCIEFLKTFQPFEDKSYLIKYNG